MEARSDRATVQQADLTELELDEPVDAVFSNAAFHWVLDQDRLFARMYDALRPGGKLVAGCGALGNLERFLEIAAGVAGEAPCASGSIRSTLRTTRKPAPNDAGRSSRQPLVAQRAQTHL